MDLNNINVLVDSFDLLLKEGTGIKTYSLTLIEALHILNSNVYLLTDRPNSINRNPILNEVLFFDRAGAEKIGSLANLAKIVLSGKAELMKRSNIVVIEKEIENISGVLNFRDCYRIARAIKRYTGATLSIHTGRKIDLWHATSPLPIRIKGAQKITTIHDVIPLRLPYTTLDNKKLYYKTLQDSLKESALIIVPSEHTKQDLLEIFHYDPAKIAVTYEPVRITPIAEDQEKISSSLKRRYNISYGKYMLFVGAIEPKKNVGRLIEAYSLIDTSMPLIIVGKKAWLWESEIGKLEAIFGKNFPRKVKLLDYVTNFELRYLYAGAYCFLFPSLYEGFGLPVLEAMTMGCPVVTSRVASLPEVCGDAAVYVDPYDVTDMKCQIESLLSSPELRASLSAAGRERAKNFDYQHYLDRLYRAYERVV